MSGNPITDSDFQAYADGLLAEDRREAVEAELARNPMRAAEVEAWQRQNETLRGLYDHIAREETPPALSPYRIERRMRGDRLRVMRIAAAAVLILGTGAVAGWYGRDMLAGLSQANFSLVGEAMAAHSLYASEVVHPVEVKADERQHMAAWLSKRLDRPLVVPDLRQDGLTLVGGRLLPANGGPAAQYMYEDEGGRRVTLFIVPASQRDETSLRYTASDGLQSYLWTDKAVACALVGDLPRERLQQIAMNAYKQFE